MDSSNKPVDQVKSMLKENVPPREILARLATAAEDLAGTVSRPQSLPQKFYFHGRTQLEDRGKDKKGISDCEIP